MPSEQRNETEYDGSRPGDCDGDGDGLCGRVSPMDDGCNDGHEALQGDEKETEDGHLRHDDDRAVGHETGVEVTRQREVGGDDTRDADGAYEEVGRGEGGYEAVGGRAKEKP